MLEEKIQKRKVNVHTDISESLKLGILLALAGGFLDSYTYITRNGVFANAQTGNIVMTGIEISFGKWGQALMHMIPIIAFVVGIILVEKIKDMHIFKSMIGTERAILAIEIVTLFFVGFINASAPDAIVTVIISFAASIQAQTFGKLAGSPYSTVMCTGNLRTASKTAYEAIKSKDKEKGIKAISYSVIIFSFVIGATIGSIITSKVGVKAVWGADIVLVSAFVLFNFDQYRMRIGKIASTNS